MKKQVSRLIFAVLAALSAGAAAAGTERGVRDDLQTSFKSLVDQDGRTFSPAWTAGKLVLVNFIFTGCGSTCPTQTAEIAKFDKSLPEAIRRRLVIVSISVDPANDDPAVLKTYAGNFGADGRRWKFLTGTMPDIVRVTRSFSAMQPGSVGNAFHTSDVRLFDARHRMIQRYAAAPLAAAQLRADVLTLARARS